MSVHFHIRVPMRVAACRVVADTSVCTCPLVPSLFVCVCISV